MGAIREDAMPGFIVLEGIDGSGKSTLAELLVKRLGRRAVLTCEPTDSWIGKAVRKGDSKNLSPFMDALLFMADRAVHTREIERLLSKGKTVVSDRYYHSTVAYQTASLRRRGLGDNFDWLLDSNLRISIRPDLTFLVTVEPETALKRARRRASLSRFEKANFLREVQRNYLRLANIDDRIVVIDGERDIDSVLNDIVSEVRRRKL